MVVNSLHIAFICQPGELEIKSILLAYSLYLNKHRNNKVLIPQHTAGDISSKTLSLFKQLNVEVVWFNNPFIQKTGQIKKGDWMSNKIYGLKSLPDSTDILFLDSDILNLRKNEFNINLNSDFAAKPADICSTANWPEIFKMANISFPGRKTKCTVDGVESPPYFNSGVLLLKKDAGKELLDAWEDYFLWLSKPERLNRDLFDIFHRDQIAFSLAIEDLQCTYSELDEFWNYPARQRTGITDDVVFAHYHDIYTLHGAPLLFNILLKLLSEYPEVRNIMQKVKPWSFLADGNYGMIKGYRYYNLIKQAISRKLARLR